MLTVSQLTESCAGRALFDDVSLQVNRGDRIGLAGPNGAGKSTLFALLLVDVSPDKERSRSRKTLRSDFFRRKPPFTFEKRCQLSSAVMMNRFRLSQCTRTCRSQVGCRLARRLRRRTQVQYAAV